MDTKFFRKDAEEDSFNIRIDYHGTWYHDGRPIERTRLAKLFSSVLHYDPEKDEYWLITPHEQGRIDVEDAPYIITEFNYDDDKLVFTTNLGHTVIPSPDHAIILKNNIPYCITTNNVPARINRQIREDLINIALAQNGFNEESGQLLLRANGHGHVIASS